jgi:hypothetical protein
MVCAAAHGLAYGSMILKKRGPKEERLVITEDPQTALHRVLKKPVKSR